MKKVITFLTLCALTALPQAAQTTEHYYSIHPDVKREYKTPFHVAVPKNFVFGFQSSSGDLLEFVPKGESVENWSEIITVMRTPGNMQPQEFMARMQQFFHSAVDKKSILRSSTGQVMEKGRKTGAFLFDGGYCDPMTKFKQSKTDNQMVFMKIARTADAVWSVQYAIKYPKTLTEDEKLPLAKKMLSFLEKCDIIPDNCE